MDPLLHQLVLREPIHSAIIRPSTENITSASRCIPIGDLSTQADFLPRLSPSHLASSHRQLHADSWSIAHCHMLSDVRLLCRPNNLLDYTPSTSVTSHRSFRLHASSVHSGGFAVRSYFSEQTTAGIQAGDGFMPCRQSYANSFDIRKTCSLD